MSFAQQIKQCEATVFVEFDYKDYISVYDSDDSDAAIKIRNLCEIDKYVEIQITGNKGDLFRVNLGFECLGSELTVKNAFIHKEHLVVMSKMLASPMPLYESPSADSRIIHRVANSYGYTYHELDCDGSWLKVSYLTHEGVKHVLGGWQNSISARIPILLVWEGNIGDISLQVTQSSAVLPMKSERGTITILRSPRPSRPL